MNERLLTGRAAGTMNGRKWVIAAGEQTFSRRRTLRRFNMERLGVIDA
jgi:hypothetical protein